MAQVKSRGVGVHSGSLHGRLSPEFRDSLEGVAGVGELRRVGQRPKLTQYLRDLWARRLFTYVDALGAASTQFARDRLGSLWLVVRPLLDAVFYYLIFAKLLKVDRGMENYIAWLLIGLFMFQFTSRCINTGTSLIRSNRPMIRAFAFPRASLGFSLAARELLQSVPAFGVMVVLLVAIPPHEMPGWSWLLVLPLFPLQFLFSLGLVFFFARIGAALPDFARLMSFVTRVLFYASGVIIPVERLLSNEVVERIVYANPIYVMLNMYRDAWIHDVPPAMSDWIYFGAWALGVFVLGFLVFWRAEETYGRD